MNFASKQMMMSILGICLIFTSKGQNYPPLLVEQNEWNVLSVGYTIPPSFDTVCHTLSYLLSGDTTFNSITYKKLYESWEESPSNWALWSCLREDDGHKVWERYADSDKEWLLYDFSLAVGDTVQVGEYPVTLQVDSITMVTINGTERNKLWLSCPWAYDYHETWTEGIGSDKGIVWSGSVLITGGWYRFLCLSNDGNLIYMNPYYSSCYIVTGINTPGSKQISFYPNPSTGYIKLNSPSNAKLLSVALYNLTGQETRSFDPEISELDLSGLRSGMYILKISLSNSTFTGKLVIN